MLNEETLRKEIKRLRAVISGLTPGLDAMLKLRGFRVYKKEPPEDLLIPEDPAGINGWYETLKKYSFRLFLRDVIKHQEGFSPKDVTRYATAEVTANYIGYLLKLGLIELRANRLEMPEEGGRGGGYEPLRVPAPRYRLSRSIKSFGPTLEWFLAEIFRREFLTEALWGVKFKRPKVGGDYDLIAKINGSLLYMEVKSSPPKQIYQSEIAAFIERVGDLSPAVSIFFMDTELRMKDKIVPMFEEALKGRQAAVRLEKELFRIGDGMFIINAKESIMGNIEKVLAWHFRGRL